MELMFRPLARYVDFQGRARRSEYWLWALFRFIISTVLAIIQYTLMFSMAATAAAKGEDNVQAATGTIGLLTVLALVNWAIILAFLLPHTAVAVRRMHDTNRSGWWIVMPYIVGLVALIVMFTVDGQAIANSFKAVKQMSQNSGDPRATFALMLQIFTSTLWVGLAMLVAKGVTFVFRVMDGTPGPNRFGPDPKGRGGNISVF